MGFQEQNLYPAWGGNPDVVIAAALITIGAAGAVSSTTGTPGIAAANGGAGVFSLTFPPCVEAIIQLTLKSAASTVEEVILTARSASAGTATIQTQVSGGTATNPASGDEIHVLIYARTSSA
jgi:hypothetical protein